MKDLGNLRVRVKPKMSEQRILASKEEVVTKEPEEEKTLRKGKTHGRKRKVQERRNVHQNRIESFLLDSSKEGKSVEAVLSETLVEPEDNQERFFSSKKDKPKKLMSNGDIIDLTAEDSEEGNLSELMKF